MANKKKREFATWRIKWYLLYIALLILFIALLVATIIFLDNGIGKTCAIIYEAFVVLVFIGTPIAIKLVNDKDSKKELQYGLSKEEQEKYLQQAKNCDIHAK